MCKLITPSKKKKGETWQEQGAKITVHWSNASISCTRGGTCCIERERQKTFHCVLCICARFRLKSWRTENQYPHSVTVKIFYSVYSIGHRQIVRSKLRSMLFPSNRLSGTNLVSCDLSFIGVKHVSDCHAHNSDDLLLMSTFIEMPVLFLCMNTCTVFPAGSLNDI